MIDRETVMASFRAVRNNTLQVARDIPAEQYGFRPAASHSSVLEFFRNLVRATEFMTSVALHPETVDLRDPAGRDAAVAAHTFSPWQTLADKDEVVKTLAASFSEIERRVNAADDALLQSKFTAPDGAEKIRLWQINCAKEQEMVIRGQLMLVERILGIVPHTTRRQHEEKTAAAR